MISNHDKLPGPQRFPLASLLETLERAFGLQATDPIRIDRIGGPGKQLWAIESVIDDGGTAVVPYRDVKVIASSDDDHLDELRCIHSRVVFGVFDATLMFVQSEDKVAERRVAAAFRSVEEYPDWEFDRRTCGGCVNDERVKKSRRAPGLAL
jgi:hypothetical protein